MGKNFGLQAKKVRPDLLGHEGMTRAGAGPGYVVKVAVLYCIAHRAGLCREWGSLRFCHGDFGGWGPSCYP